MNLEKRMEEIARENMARVLEALRSVKRTKAWTAPDVPYVGPDYEGASLRLAVVGKANLRWPPPKSRLFEQPVGKEGAPDFERLAAHPGLFDEMQRVSRRFRSVAIPETLAGKKPEDGYSSQWWRTICQTWTGLTLADSPDARPTLPRPAEVGPHARTCFRSLFATNLYKVTIHEANPSGAMRRAQAPLLTHVRRELEAAQPALVWMPVNEFATDAIQALPPGSMKLDLGVGSQHVLAAFRTSFGGVPSAAVVTSHPQGKDVDALQEILEALHAARWSLK